MDNYLEVNVQTNVYIIELRYFNLKSVGLHPNLIVGKNYN